jgi:uncharacterized repeat protein (TIGR01451 family)
MAGYTGLAAKLLVGTSVLSSVGAGGYYVATSGYQLPTLGAAANRSDENNAAAEVGTGELDAIASAWAQPLPENSAPPSSTDAGALSSSTARTANATIPSADVATPTAMPDDRYGIYPGMQAAVDVAPATSTSQSGASSPPTNSRDRTQLVAQPIETPPPATHHRQADVVPSTASAAIVPGLAAASTVARGQEPSEPADGATIETLSVSDTTPAAEDSNQAADLAEPQPMSVPVDERPLNTAAQRARNAFEDEPPSAQSDPYASPTATSASADPATANPFEAAPASTAAQPNVPDTIEKLPAFSGNDASATDSLPSPVSAESEPTASRIGRPASRSARASFNSAADRFEARPEPISSDPQTPTADNSPGSAFDDTSFANTAGDATMINGTGRPGERALEGPQNASLVIQKVAPAEVQVNKPAKFLIQVRNAGSQAAENVEVRDEVPQGTRLVSTTPSAQAVGNQLVWQIGKLSAGEEQTLEMQLVPHTEGEIGSVATVSYSAQASVKTRCTMPKLAIRMTAPEKVLIGQEQRVKIELANPGTGAATGVMLFENVPENLKHAAGPALEFEIGTLRPGETRTLELVLVAEKAGKVVNTLIARADGNLQVQEQATFEVIAPALAVEVNGPQRRYLERPATYEVSIANPGTAPAYDVQIITKLPKGMRFVRANNMGEYDATSHAVYWSLAELPEGESGTVEVVAMPIETGQQLLEVETRAGQGLSDQAKQQVTVEGLAAIMFELHDLEDPIEVGGETGYEIRVLNEGTKAATNVRVAVGMSPGMQFVSAEGETQYEVQGSTLLFEPLVELAPKANSVFRIKTRGARAGDQRVKVEVMTDDLSEPIRREESTRVFGDE